MSTVTGSRRRQRRYSVQDDRVARVEFAHPAPNGPQFRLSITNISSSGVSFSFDANDELIGLEEGTSISDAAIRVRNCMIRGELLVMHVTPQQGSRKICGALFYPASDNDLVQYKGVIAGMEISAVD